MTETSATEPKAPGLDLMLMEARCVMEGLRLARHWRDFDDLPRGHGQPVMVIPGFGLGDGATMPLRTILRRCGYASYGWKQGRNLGMRSEIKANLAASVAALHQRHSLKVTLIGWSLGGVFARETARHCAGHVERVITLGSPISGHPSANNVESLYNLVTRQKPSNTSLEGFRKRMSPPPVQCSAFYSRSDGVVAWECSQEQESDHTENVEVVSSHFGMVLNPDVIREILRTLAEPVTPPQAASAA